MPRDLRADHDAGEQRILAAVFEVAAVARLAHQVHAARQHHVEARGARLGADHRARAARELRIPARRGGDARRQRGALALFLGAALRGDADAGVGVPLRRNAEARDAGHVAGGAGARFGRDGEFLPGRIRAEVAEHQRLLFLARHLRDHELGARSGSSAGFIQGLASLAAEAHTGMNVAPMAMQAANRLRRMSHDSPRRQRDALQHIPRRPAARA